MRIEARTIGFVRALIAGETATREGARYVLADGRRIAAGVVGDLIARGALAGDRHGCRANGESAGWVRRCRLEAGSSLASQHRLEARTPGGGLVNRAESEIARLGLGETPYLARHQVEAGERLRRLVERAHLQPRMTARYSPADAVGSRAGDIADLSDLAADARKSLAGLYAVVSRESLDVAVDVCGFLKSLDQVERDFDLPRRSGKLVLRIGLEQIALAWGIAAVARGPEHGRLRGWVSADGRPTDFG